MSAHPGEKPGSTEKAPFESSSVHEVGDGSSRTGTKPKSKPRLFKLLRAAVCCVVGLHLVHHAATSWPWPSRTSSDAGGASVGTVRWFACDAYGLVDAGPNVDCGSIVVPLDYFNASVGVGTLALARLGASATPKKGTVFVNPGGPGGSGVSLIARRGAQLAELIGPHYDIVGFDPRGIGATIPKVQCFPSPAHQQYFVANTVFEQGFTVSSNLSDARTRAHLVEQYREFLALKRTQATLCAQNMGEQLRYMGTATVVRDIDFMATVFDGEDALINYWGGSYGSILGAYLVNMFPDRVGRIAIDGIANPVLWAAEPSQYWHRDWIASAEDTYSMFLSDCSKAGPVSCPLARFENEDPKEIGARIDEFLDELYETPLAVPNARRPGFLTAGGVRALLLISMEQPRTWPHTSSILAEAMAGNGSALLDTLLPPYAPDPPPANAPSKDLERLAVTCLDSPPPADIDSDADAFPTPERLADIGLATIAEVSPHFGMSVSISEPDGGCQFWPVKGPERFTGPWNHTLRNPILIVSNTADPVTPIASGRLVNSLLSNSSRLLIQNSPGHCSLGLTSLCTIKAYRAFFTNGTLLPNEFVCEVDEASFPISEEVSTLGEEDRRLLESARELGQWMASEKLRGMFSGGQY